VQPGGDPVTNRPAPRPTPRTVHVKLSGAFDGWEVTARADFPARLLADLQSGELTRIWTVLDEIVTEHNLPNGQDELADAMADVDPYDGLLEVATGIFDAIGKLPNR
jgi:hypothetical protein